MARWRCPLANHGSHNGLEHPNCYARLAGLIPTRIGYLDIEASSLNASFGMMLSWAIKDRDGELHSDVVTLEDLKKNRDKRIVASLIDTIENNFYDLLVVYYGKNARGRYDLPFARTRAILHGLQFPSGIKILDLYDVCGSKLKIRDGFHVGRLEDVCETLGIIDDKYVKTPIKPSIWLDALQGDKKALEYILDHNKKDVLLLEKLHMVLEPYITSIRSRL